MNCWYDGKTAVARVAFNDADIVICQEHLVQYLALDVNDPECNVREIVVRPLVA